MRSQPNIGAIICIIFSICGFIGGSCLVYYYNINSYENTKCYTHSLSDTYQFNKVRWGFTYILSAQGEICGTEYSISTSLENIDDMRISYDNKIVRCWYPKSDICNILDYSPSIGFGFGIFLCASCGVPIVGFIIGYPIYCIYNWYKKSRKRSEHDKA